MAAVCAVSAAPWAVDAASAAVCASWAACAASLAACVAVVAAVVALPSAAAAASWAAFAASWASFAEVPAAVAASWAVVAASLVYGIGDGGLLELLEHSRRRGLEGGRVLIAAIRPYPFYDPVFIRVLIKSKSSGNVCMWIRSSMLTLVFSSPRYWSVLAVSVGGISSSHTIRVVKQRSRSPIRLYTAARSLSSGIAICRARNERLSRPTSPPFP